jgi:hypothetical protein
MWNIIEFFKRHLLYVAQMEPSPTSYNDAKTYSQNLADRTLASYALDAISHRLNAQAPRLFTGQAQEALDFLDLGNRAEGMFNVFLEVNWLQC